MAWKNTMHVFQTAGVPPRSGSTILAIIGWTTNSSDELRNSVMAKTKTMPGQAQTLCPLSCHRGRRKPEKPPDFTLGVNARTRFWYVDYRSECRASVGTRDRTPRYSSHPAGPNRKVRIRHGTTNR